MIRESGRMAKSIAWITFAAMILASTTVITTLVSGTLVGAQEKETEQTVASGQDAGSARTDAKGSPNEWGRGTGESGKSSAAKSQYEAPLAGKQSAVSQGQETQGGVKAAQADTLTNEPARIIDEESDANPDDIVNRIVATISSCDVEDNATITVEDGDGTRVTFANGDGVTITGSQDRLVVQGTEENGNVGDADFVGGNDRNFNTGDGTLVSSTGINCGGDDGGESPSGRTGGNGEAVDNLLALGCEELLQRIQDGGDGQYSDRSATADPDVQARIAECRDRQDESNDEEDDDEIVNIPDDDLPDTGGLPLLGLAVLGIATIFAGASVIRGVGRGE